MAFYFDGIISANTKEVQAKMVYVMLGHGEGSRNSKARPEDLIWLSLEIEQSKLNREKSLLMLDKSLLMYFAFLIVGIVGFINRYMTVQLLNVVVILSFCVLASGLIPYMITMSKEENRLNALLGAYRTKEKKTFQNAGKSQRKAKRR